MRPYLHKLNKLVTRTNGFSYLPCGLKMNGGSTLKETGMDLAFENERNQFEVCRQIILVRETRTKEKAIELLRKVKE